MEDFNQKIPGTKGFMKDDGKAEGPNLKEKTADLADHVEELAQTFYKLAIVNVTQKTTNAVSTLLVLMSVSILGLVAFIFLGISLSIWLGSMIGSMALGFLLGAAIFLLLLAIIIMLRKNIVFPFIRDLLIRKLYDKTN